MFEGLKNLKNLSQLASLLGDGSAMREKLAQMQQRLERLRVTGDAGAGAVRITVNGKMRALRVEIDAAALSVLTGSGLEADRQLVEELIASAFNDAVEKAQAAGQEELAGLAPGGIDLKQVIGE